MKIAIGSDHGGFELKEQLKKYLIDRNIEVVDYGTKSEESVNYSDFGHAVAEHVVKKQDKGIVICGSGIGISITTNRHKGVRAALIRNKEEAILARQHNDANILALGGRVTSFEVAKEILDAFLQTEFEGGRHIQRIKGIEVK